MATILPRNFHAIAGARGCKLLPPVAWQLKRRCGARSLVLLLPMALLAVIYFMVPAS